MATKGAVARIRTRARKTEHTWADRLETVLPWPIRGVVARARQDEIPFLSAGLAFYAVVSIAPLVILVVALASLVVGDSRMHELARQLGSSGPKDLGVDQALLTISKQSSRLSVVAFVAALWPASAYGSGLVRAFDHLSQKHREAEGFRGRGLALVVLLPLFVLGGIVGSYAGWAALGTSPGVRAAGAVLALLGAFVAAGGALALIYRIFPPEHLGWRAILAGAASGAISISVLSLAFTLYLSLGANFQEHYGSSSVAAYVLLAVWLFLANALTLVGYRIALEVAGRRRRRS
jgi:membrane protein